MPSLWELMYRVGFEGVNICQFFDVQISMKLSNHCKISKKNSYLWAKFRRVNTG